MDGANMSESAASSSFYSSAQCFGASNQLMRTITLEEHFVTSSFVKATEDPRHGVPAAIAQLRPKLLDLGAGRIAAMDEAGIDFQVLSLASMGMDALTPDVATPLARDVNDELADAIRANPTRLGAFASLALRDPAKAAQELERCISRLGFVGVMFDGTTDGLFLDDPRFLPVWEAAATLRVPVYLHPAPPPEDVHRATTPDFLAISACFFQSPAGDGMQRRDCTRFD